MPAVLTPSHEDSVLGESNEVLSTEAKLADFTYVAPGPLDRV